MNKRYRQSVILDLVKSGSVNTQAELCRKLARRGIRATQATVSRDIEELGIAKTRDGYRVPDSVGPVMAPQPALHVVLKEFVRAVLRAGSLVIVKTHPGNAHTVGVALDSAAWPEIVGTVAGDDTIFVACPRELAAAEVRKRLLDLMAR